MSAPAARRDAAKVRRKKMKKTKDFADFLKKQVEKHKMDEK